MSEKKEAREEWLTRVVAMRVESERRDIDLFFKKYHSINRGAVLYTLSWVFSDRGLKSYFIDNDWRGLKQNFYVSSKLLMASLLEEDSGLDPFAAYQPFLYGLLSDSPEVYNWLACAELKNKDYVKGVHFAFHQFQLVLQGDDEALRETIAVVSKKGGNREKALAKAGKDFFSLLLKKDKEGLQTLIENAAKIKSADELIGQFLAGYAVIFAKLCWYRGIDVQIQNPLVPMPLMPIQPLDAYDVEYDFLRPGWTPPPPPGLFSKVKRWFS